MRAGVACPHCGGSVVKLLVHDGNGKAFTVRQCAQCGREPFLVAATPKRGGPPRRNRRATYWTTYVRPGCDREFRPVYSSQNIPSRYCGTSCAAQDSWDRRKAAEL